MPQTAKVKTYLDANVLIRAWRGRSDPQNNVAWKLVFSPTRAFIASPLLKLETIPTAKRNGHSDEVAFYEFYFSRVQWIPMEDAVAEAMNICSARQGFGNFDAVHAASARLGQIDEFVTNEGTTKPFFWLSDINPVHVLDPALVP